MLGAGEVDGREPESELAGGRPSLVASVVELAQVSGGEGEIVGEMSFALVAFVAGVRGRVEARHAGVGRGPEHEIHEAQGPCQAGHESGPDPAIAVECSLFVQCVVNPVDGDQVHVVDEHATRESRLRPHFDQQLVDTPLEVRGHFELERVVLPVLVWVLGCFQDRVDRGVPRGRDTDQEALLTDEVHSPPQFQLEVPGADRKGRVVRDDCGQRRGVGGPEVEPRDGAAFHPEGVHRSGGGVSRDLRRPPPTVRPECLTVFGLDDVLESSIFDQAVLPPLPGIGVAEARRRPDQRAAEHRVAVGEDPDRRVFGALHAQRQRFVPHVAAPQLQAIPRAQL